MACEDFNTDLLPQHIVSFSYDCADTDCGVSGRTDMLTHYGDATQLQTTTRYTGNNARSAGIYDFTVASCDGKQGRTCHVNVNPARWFSDEIIIVNYPNEIVPAGTVITNFSYFGSDISAVRGSFWLRNASDPDILTYGFPFSYSDDKNQLIAHGGLNGYENPVLKINADIREGDNSNKDHWDSTYVIVNIPRNIPLSTSLVPIPHVNMHDVIANVTDIVPVDAVIGTISFDTRGSDEHFSVSSNKFRIDGLNVVVNESLAFGQYNINEVITLTTSSTTLTCNLTVHVSEASAPDLSGWILTDDTVNDASDNEIILLTDNLVYTPATQVFSHDANLIHWDNHYIPQPLGPEIPIVDPGSYQYNFIDASLITEGETFSITVENAKGSDTKDFILHKEKDSENMLSGSSDYTLDHSVNTGDTILTLSIISPYAGNIIVATTTNTRVAIGLDGAVTALEDITMNCDETLTFNIHLETVDKQHNSSFDIYNGVNEPICDPALLYINEGLPIGTIIGSIYDFVTDTNGCTNIVYELAESGQPYNPRWVSPAWINDIISLNHDTGEITSRVVFDFSVENQYDFAVFVNNGAENGAGWCDVSISINEV